ncbi:MAG: undecaprenyldiphospho-muramoylpentapeptide beta-N-acetylglucosaminyltransferase [Desulfovibrionaceae bacterium]|nr:undecaprenyldiphospho-muramoylpentapeptide beta-N-acetylglucosaminyltransferase [Desulfovibrionaceae bacterium]
MCKIVLTTGGTGGHIFPALAVACALRELEPKCELLFMGANYGPEATLAAQAGVPFIGLNVRGFLGRGLAAFKAFALMLRAQVKARQILQEFRPACVVGFGSYAAFAPMLAAQLLGIPTILHEQNAVAGTSNRILGFRAKQICLTLRHTLGFKAQKCVLTGNPVRANLVQVAHERVHHEPNNRHLLVLGGSQGCHALNAFMVQHLKSFKAQDVQIYHQTGKADFKSVQAAYVQAGYAKDSVLDFVSDMHELYAWADLAFCRAGASTVAELAVLGLPAVFVPFPYAIHNHQLRNGEEVAQAGGGLVLLESELAKATSLEMLLNLLQDIPRLKSMQEKVKTLAKPQAAQDVARLALKYAHKT